MNKTKEPGTFEFAGRELVIATKHGKEKVIGPIFQEHLKVKPVVPPDLDTDSLGTFSGEIPRKDTIVNTLRKKCELAFDAYGGDLCLASEGSFGPHPSLFFAMADEEYLMLTDKKHDLEIVVKEISFHTNFAGEIISSAHELSEFAQRCKFPSHALIVRNEPGGEGYLVKGIRDMKSLQNHVQEVIHLYGSAFIETDMRAHLNPMRMNVIQQATNALIQKIQSACPACTAPGFGITDAKPGLPCRACGYATESILAFIHQCSTCGFMQEELYPKGKTAEDPSYCNYCNP